MSKAEDARREGRNQYIALPHNKIGVVLTRGKIARIDPEDFDKIRSMRWHANNQGYAKHDIQNKSGKRHYLMHRIISGCPEGMLVDHKNGDRLDNTKANLRICTPHQNNHSYRPPKRNPDSKTYSEFKGVIKTKSGWHARASLNNKDIFLGAYNDEVEAAKAYDRFILEKRGEFAILNFPPGESHG